MKTIKEESRKNRKQVMKIKEEKDIRRIELPVIIPLQKQCQLKMRRHRNFLEVKHEN